MLFMLESFPHGRNPRIRSLRAGSARVPILIRMTAGLIALCALALYFILNEPQAEPGQRDSMGTVFPAKYAENQHQSKALARRVVSISGKKILSVDYSVPEGTRPFAHLLKDIDLERSSSYAGYRFRYYWPSRPDLPCLDVFASEGMREYLSGFEHQMNQGSLMLAWNDF